MLNDTSTSAMTVLRLTINGQKVSGGPNPRDPCLFSQIVGIVLLISLWNYPAHKTNHPCTPRPLPPFEKDCTILPLECVSLLSLYYDLFLNCFPVWSQGPLLGNLSQRLTWDLGRDHSLVPHFPTTSLQRILINLLLTYYSASHWLSSAPRHKEPDLH